MNAPPSRLQASINVTPLVDVMLALLIIFLVVTPLVGKGVDVELPVTPHPEKRDPDKTGPLTVSLRYGGDANRAEIYLGERPVADPAQLLRELEAPGATAAAKSVTLRADARLHFAAVRPVMKALQDRGYPGVDLAARPLDPR